MRHAATSPRRVTISARYWLRQRCVMDSVNHLLRIFMRQARLERALVHQGPVRIRRERELNISTQQPDDSAEAVPAMAGVQDHDGA